MNTFQMEGRYPDYQFIIYQAFTAKRTADVLAEAEKHVQWLLEKLP